MFYDDSDVREGTYNCPGCGALITVRKVRYPDNDIRHEVGCPECNCTLGHASGTEDYDVWLARKPEKVCPVCNREMVRRSGPYGKFWGCTGYPKYCDYTEKIEE